MQNLKDILNRVIETPLIFPPSATGNAPKNSWEDPGTHYYIDYSGIFTRTKTGKYRYRPIMYGTFEIVNSRKRFDNLINPENYEKLSFYRHVMLHKSCVIPNLFRDLSDRC